MNASTRAVLKAGVAALSLGALAVAVSIPPESMRTIQVLRPANFAADIVPNSLGEPIEPPSEDELDSALALIEQLAPVADGRVVTVNLSGHEEPVSATIAPAAPKVGEALETGGGSAVITHQAAVDGPVAQNQASDAIDRIYSISRYWSSYVALELGPWLINWIPFGYLVSDQIYIWYPDLVQPTVESFVYDFLDPVVNDPTNPEVWITGIGDILNTARAGIGAGVAAEINYIVTFGWFPIPLPPLPNFPLPGLAPTSAPVAASLTSIDADETGTEGTAEDATASTDVTEDETTEPADVAEDETTELADVPEDETTEPADVAEDETTEPADVTEDEDEATDTVTSDGSAERTTGTITEDADETVADMVESATEPGDDPELAVEPVEAEQSEEAADSGTDAQQDSASGSDDSDSDSATSNTSASDED